MFQKDFYQKLGFFILFFFVFNTLVAQNRFGGGVILGFNAAQLNGDFSAGYNKAGLNVGLRVTAELKDRWQLATEMLWSQRGARSRSSEFVVPRSCSLDYLEVPVYISLRDWLVTKEGKKPFYKTNISAGFSYARLFRRSANPAFSHRDLLSDFATNDVSVVFSVAYFANRHLGFNMRLSRSLTPLFNPEKYAANDPRAAFTPLWGHFISVQSCYMF